MPDNLEPKLSRKTDLKIPLLWSNALSQIFAHLHTMQACQIAIKP
jgi:hypothetical protein